MLGITRYCTDESTALGFSEKLAAALAAFASCPGFVSGQVARATDDPHLWTLIVDFESMGSYRRALSSYRVKAEAVPVMYLAVDAPSAFEPVAAHDGDALRVFESDLVTDGTRGDGVVAPGRDRLI